MVTGEVKASPTWLPAALLMAAVPVRLKMPLISMPSVSRSLAATVALKTIAVVPVPLT